MQRKNYRFCRRLEIELAYKGKAYRRAINRELV